MKKVFLFLSLFVALGSTMTSCSEDDGIEQLCKEKSNLYDQLFRDIDSKYDIQASYYEMAIYVTGQYLRTIKASDMKKEGNYIYIGNEMRFHISSFVGYDIPKKKLYFD